MRYDPSAIEPKWQAAWEAQRVFRGLTDVGVQWRRKRARGETVNSPARWLALVCAVLLPASGSTARAAGVVGTGSAASCSDAALSPALAGGGLVTFNCGPAPVTIDISTGTGTKTITADTTIDGGGLITISGGNSVGVLSVNSDVNFTVQNLTIANGRNLTRADDSITGRGGGIYNYNGTLTVTNCTFTANSATYGSGVAGYGRGGAIYNTGTLTVTNSTFSDNSTDAYGGGIENSGLLSITRSTFTGNSSSISGGGIENGGLLTITDSTFTSNGTGALGGGIESSGSLTVTHCTFTGNDSAGDGGGIGNFGTLTVTNSTFTGNSGGGAGGIRNDGSMTVTNSAFTGNSGHQGSGILNVYRGTLGSGTLTVANSTFTGNSDGAIKSDGSLTVINSTFAGNVGYNILNAFFNNPPGLALVFNTVVANTLVGPNCAGSITDGGHNLDSGTSCGFSTANGSSSNTNPQLDPVGLRDNGGPTQTIALLPGSPAIDAGDPAVCAIPPVDGLDQRGFVRPGIGHTQCSIGAYEADAIVSCTGDCDDNGKVAINELILGVNIVLGVQPDTACPAFANSLELVDIAQLIKGVNNALNGCSPG